MAVDFHREILPPTQAEVLASLAPLLSPHGFYLAGGTSLALQVGHRRSEDFDWFHPDAHLDPLALAATLKSQGVDLEIRGTSRGTLHASWRQVRLTFIAYPYPLLGPLLAWPEVACSLASLADLAGMKLAAVAQRGSRKDFVDIYALGRRAMPLQAMLAHFRNKYAMHNLSHVLVALAYFEDAESEPMPEMLWPEDWATIKRTLQDWLRDTTRAKPSD